MAKFLPFPPDSFNFASFPVENGTNLYHCKFREPYTHKFIKFENLDLEEWIVEHNQTDNLCYVDFYVGFECDDENTAIEYNLRWL